jgi:hypothetical protein
LAALTVRGAEVIFHPEELTGEFIGDGFSEDGFTAMISLTCTHCQTVLSIDDAFAGGVCRCQHCGTIQTVPSHLKRGATVKAGASEGQTAGNGPKALYQSKRTAGRSDETGSGTGLEDLADVVASSGLADGSLTKSQKSRKPQNRPADSDVAAPSPRSKTPMLIAGSIVLVLIAVGAIWWISTLNKKPVQSPSPSAGGDVSANADTPSPTPAPAAGPQFADLPLVGNSIVYLLDRGDSAKQVFDSMREATFKSIESLGPERKFQVLLWDNNTSQAGYPSGSTTFASKENIDACRKALEDVIAQHQSTIDGPLKTAVAEGPDAIVIVTAKGFGLDDSFATDVQSVVGTNPIKLFTISIQNTDQADCVPLQTLAKQSGGAYKSVSSGALRAAGGN